MNNCKYIIIRALLILMVTCSLCVIMVGLISCRPTKLLSEVTPTIPSTHISIPIKTISQDAPLGDYPSDPLYTVVFENSEWEKLDGHLPQQTVITGKQWGYKSDDVIIVVYAGVKGSSGYEIQIDSVYFEGGDFKIKVKESEPGLDEVKEPAKTLPYQLVSLPREYISQQELIDFSFIDEGGVVLHQMEIILP